MALHHHAGSRRALALVELLVVIAIVGVLLGVLLPALAGAREGGRAVKCLANLRSMGQAVQMYADENRDHFPLSSHTTGSLLDPACWVTSLEGFGFPRSVQACPSDPFRGSRLTSYASNEHFEPLAPGIDFNPITGVLLAGGRERAYERLADVPRPGATIYAMEPSGEGNVDHLNTHLFDTLALSRAVAVTRHAGASNALFADAHAGAMPWHELESSFGPETSPFDPETAR